jgi:hypothetical protein
MGLTRGHVYIILEARSDRVARDEVQIGAVEEDALNLQQGFTLSGDWISGEAPRP